jgi:hypothetical protein
MQALAVLIAAAAALGGSASKDPRFIDSRVETVVLGDTSSGQSFVSRLGGNAVDIGGGMAVFRYAGTAELLELVAYPGGEPYQFWEVRLRRGRGTEPNAKLVAGGKPFRSGRGIQLGLTISEVVRLLGEPQEQSETKGRLNFVYRCTSEATCPALKRVNMPEYKGRYSFLDGRLVECEWGYPYP